MEQLTILPNATPEEREAAQAHFEIVKAAQAAANHLLDLGRKLKHMRDSGLYKHLGFQSFGDYTETAVGIKQRQAYNYIQVIESLPAKLIEENAAAGVTKLALLAKLGPDDREEVAGDLANITVAELNRIIKERDSMAEQLTMFQGADPVADVEAEPVEQEDPAEITRRAVEEAERRMAQEWEKERAALEAAKDKAVAKAAREAEKAAAAEIKKAKETAQKEAAKKAEQAIREAREAGARQATEILQGRQNHELEAAKKRAEDLAKQLEVAADEQGTRFAVLFDELQGRVNDLHEIAALMQSNGKEDTARKYGAALARALAAFARKEEAAWID